MIKRATDMRSKTIHALKDGKGDIQLMEFFGPDDFCRKGRCFGITAMPPGTSIGYHRHEGDQEAYYILDGKAEYTYDGKTTELQPGDLAVCKEGHCHSIESVGDDTLRYITLILYT